MKKEEIARFAYESVPFYRELVAEYPGVFEKLPVISKKMMLDGVGKNLAPEYMMDYLSGRLERVSTSGSTGQCLNIYWDKEQQKKSLLPLWCLRKKYYKIMPQDKYCFFYTTGVMNGKNIEKTVFRNGIAFSKIGLTEKRLLHIYEEICEYQPVWMLLQPSMALMLIHIAEKYGLEAPGSVRYIELTGERYEEKVKVRIQTFFQCDTASQYGCYEAGCIAYECPQGNHHVVESSVFVEVLDEKNHPVEDREGSITITSLQNKVMPFIRYRIGDRGTIGSGRICSCGNCSPIVKLTKARENDMIVNRDKTKTHSDIFAHAVEMVNLLTDNIIQYQIIQKDYEVFEIYLVVEERGEWERTKQLFIEALEDFAFGKKLHFEQVDTLVLNERTGKLAWFQSELSQ